MTKHTTITRRTLVKTGIGVIAAPAVLRVLPAEAQTERSRSAMSVLKRARSPLRRSDGFILHQVRDILSKGWSTAARPTRSRSSPRTASRMPAAPPRSPPN